MPIEYDDDIQAIRGMSDLAKEIRQSVANYKNNPGQAQYQAIVQRCQVFKEVMEYNQHLIDKALMLSTPEIASHAESLLQGRSASEWISHNAYAGGYEDIEIEGYIQIKQLNEFLQKELPQVQPKLNAADDAKEIDKLLKHLDDIKHEIDTHAKNLEKQKRELTDIVDPKERKDKSAQIAANFQLLRTSLIEYKQHFHAANQKMQDPNQLQHSAVSPTNKRRFDEHAGFCRQEVDSGNMLHAAAQEAVPRQEWKKASPSRRE